MIIEADGTIGIITEGWCSYCGRYFKSSQEHQDYLAYSLLNLGPTIISYVAPPSSPKSGAEARRPSGEDERRQPLSAPSPPSEKLEE